MKVNLGRGRVVEQEKELLKKDWIGSCAMKDGGAVSKTRNAEKRRRRFFFDQRWLQQKDVGKIVDKAWNEKCTGSRCFVIKQKIKYMRVALLRWNKQLNLNQRGQIEQLKVEIQRLKHGNQGENEQKLPDLKRQLHEVYKIEEMFWKQKARIQWLKEGDRNTSYFHASVAARRRKNRISSLQKSNGQWCINNSEVESEINQYFSTIFSSNPNGNCDEILNGISPSITPQVNMYLTRPVSAPEVKKAIFSMNPNKSPGLDDDTLLFCKASKDEAQHIVNILGYYAEASGQVINMEKCSVSFSKNVPNATRKEILSNLGNMRYAGQRT